MFTRKLLFYLLILFLATALFQVVTHSLSLVRAQSTNEPPPPQSSDYYLNPDNYQITPVPTVFSSGGNHQEVRPLDTLSVPGSYTVSDDFTGTTVNDQNWWQPNSYTTVANNQLKMQLGTAVKNGGTDLWSKKRFKGDFQEEIDLVSFQKGQNVTGYADARFWMNNDWAGWVSMDLRLNNQSDPRGDLFCTVRYLDNNNNPVFLDIGRDNLDTIPASTNLRLRITRVGNTVSCSYNAGGGFIVLGSKEVPDWADRVFAPFISSWKGGADNVSSTAIWDNFTASGTLAEIVGNWNMDEGSGQTVGDYSGKGNNGTATGTSIVYGKKWNGRSFNGIGDYIALSSQPPLKDGFTFESWVNFDSGANFNNYQEIFNNNQFFIRKDNNVEGNKISAFIRRLSDDSIGPRVSSTTIPVPGKWYHVSAIWNGSTLRMYINGSLEGTVSREGSLSTSVVQAQFGRGEQTSLTSSPLAGKLDEVKIYNYVRTPFQIYEDMLGWVQTTQTVTDNFESPSLDLTKWNIGKTNDAIQISQTNGGVYMTIPGNIPNGSGTLELKQRISSDFKFDIDLGSFQIDQVRAQVGTAIIIIKQQNKSFELRWVKDNPDGTSYIDYYMIQNGQTDDGPAYVIPGNSYPRVRLMRKGRVFYGAVYNGYGWQPVFMVDGFRGDNDTVSFTLNKGNGGTSTQDVKVYFDNLWGIYNNNCVRGLKGNLDCSGEGMVDTADFELFRQVFGKPIGSVSVGNNMFSPDIFVDANDQIDTADFEIFRSNFGKSN